MPTDFLSVLQLFQASRVRYVLVGGLAVLLHGIDRLTANIDLVVDLAPDQASRAVEILLAAGFKAGAPVDARVFADPAVRERWRTESDMLAFSKTSTTRGGSPRSSGRLELMNHDQATPAITTFGSWQDAENLRKWSFLQRTPQQRLDWLVQALEIAFQCGALRARVAGDGERA